MLFQAIILGIVQGLTEFIPVSSSAHLLVLPKLFGWKDMGLSFDVALHLGTLAALLGYFRKDWAGIVRSFVQHTFKKTPYEGGATSGRLMVPIIVATVPAAVVGLLFDDKIEALRDWRFMMLAVAGVLLLISVVMFVSEKVGKRQRGLDKMGYADYMFIGCAQALALFPGVSRSGITISAGLFRNLDREAAARFSFLLSTPAILGAGLLTLKDIVGTGLPSPERLPFLAGFLAATVSGYLAIGFLMSYLRRRPLNAFVVYRVCFAVAMIGVFLLRGA